MVTEAFKLNVLDVEIDVIRKDIKHLHLSVYPPSGRVRIASPMDVNEDTIRLFAINKLKWIRNNQKKQINQIRQTPREYIAGESHWALGKRYLLEIEYITSGRHEVLIKNKKFLLLKIRKGTNTKNREKVFDEFYRKQLHGLLPEIIEKWSKQLKVSCKEYAILKMSTKWGSCAIEKSKIILNLELGKKSIPEVEYVILHELTHLLERNHNNSFIKLLDYHMPDWRNRRHDLNQRL